MKSTLVLASLFVAGGLCAQTGQTPIAVSGFNQDMVVDDGTRLNPTTMQNAISATMDSGTSRLNNTWYETGENASSPGTGLPMGITFVSAADPTTSFTLQSASGNNAIMLDATHANGTFTLTSPAIFTSLTLLGASAVGPTTIGVVLQFTDSSSLSLGNVVVPDWFNNAPMAFDSDGRLNVGTGFFNSVGSDNPRLYQVDLNLPGDALIKQISSVAFTDISGGSSRVGLFALSGTVAAIPEPSTLVLLIAGLAGMIFLRRLFALSGRGEVR
jgi:hypothetical protein